MSADPQPEYIDCLADFKQELGKLSTWDLRCLANINKENFISVTEACDPKTDAMVGWEKCTTLAGLKAKKVIPDAAKLTDAEMLNLFDNLLSREFATLDGQRIMLGPFACVYLHDLETLAKSNEVVYAFLKSFLASTFMLYSITGEAAVLENEELMFQCAEVLMLCQGSDLDESISLLKAAAEKTTNADIKLRLELRATMLKTLFTLYCAHSIANSDVDAAVTEAAQIASDLRSKLIVSRKKLGAITSDAKLFPEDVRFWLTTNSATPSTEPDLTAQLEKVAEFYASLSGFTAFAACKNFFEIAVVAEKVAAKAPCSMTRPFAYAFIFRDRPTEQPQRFARGDRLLGGQNLRVAILKYLETELAAPLYFNLLDTSVAPVNNTHLQDVAHYLLGLNEKGGLSGAKPPQGQLLQVQQQLIHTLLRWLEVAAHCVVDSIQSALFNAGRHHRRIANRFTELNNLLNISSEVDVRFFCARVPQPGMTDANLAREMSSRAAILSTFARDLILDAMEKFVRLTMRLELPTKPEFVACTWYLELLTSTRVEIFQNAAVRAQDRALLIPERKVNKKTGNPLANPALTSRGVTPVGNSTMARTHLAKQIAEVTFIVFAIIQTHNIIGGYENASTTSLTSAENMFDHRFNYLNRCYFPVLPPFSACASRIQRLKGTPLFHLVSTVLTMSTEMTKLAKHHAAETAANGSVYAEEFAALEKSIAALAATMLLLRGLLFPNVAEGARVADVPNPTPEDVTKALEGYEITLEAPYDKSVVVPLLRKKSE